MKFSDSIACQRAAIFDNTRNTLDQYILFQIIKQRQFQNLLEIGYYQGLTFSILYEASAIDANLVACDITFEHDQLSKFVKFDKHVNFQKCSSTELLIDRLFDFVNIDGEHSYTAVSKELAFIVPWVSPQGMIMIDDYHYPEIQLALQEFLLMNSEFKIFLQGPQQLFISRTDNDLDWLVTYTDKICSWSINGDTHQLYRYNYKNAVFIDKLHDIIMELKL